MLLLFVLKLLEHYIKVIHFMLIGNQPSIGQISFAKTDNMFHIQAVPLRMCNGLMKCVCVCVYTPL